MTTPKTKIVKQEEFEQHLVTSKLSGEIHVLPIVITYDQYEEYCRGLVDYMTSEYSISMPTSDVIKRQDVYAAFKATVDKNLKGVIESVVSDEISECAYSDWKSLFKQEINDYEEEQRLKKIEADRIRKEEELKMANQSILVLKSPESLKKAKAILKAAGLL